MIHPFISGNKWRKLKYNLITAHNENKNHLVTFGGVWSNHLLATACAASKYGFRSTAFIRGEDVDNEVIFLCRLFGMQLLFTDRESYRDKQTLFNKHFEGDSSAFFIDEGGSGSAAAMGCAELIKELPETYNHIFCAAGTGTTAAGLINGLINYGSNAKMNVVPVLKGANFLKDDINQLLIQHCDFNFLSEYHFGGYAKTEPKLLEFITNFSTSTGILLDPVYTGKLLYAIFDLIKKGSFTPGTRILAIHTGGLFGLLGMREKFRTLLNQ